MTTVQKKKLASDLKPGDWLASSETEGEPGEILFTKPFSDGGMTLVVYGDIDEIPQTLRLHSEREVELATVGDREQMLADRLRYRVADQLRDVAQLVDDGEIESGKRLEICIKLDSFQAVDALAERMGAKVDIDSAKRHSLWWPFGQSEYAEGLHVEWYEYDRTGDQAERAVAADPTGLGYSREADDPTPTTAVPATVEGHAEFSGRATVPPLCRHVAEVSGVPCNRPLEWLPGAWWVHVDETGIDHLANGPESDGGE